MAIKSEQTDVRLNERQMAEESERANHIVNV